MRPVKLLLIAAVAVVALLGIVGAIVSWQSSIEAGRLFDTGTPPPIPEPPSDPPPIAEPPSDPPPPESLPTDTGENPPLPRDGEPENDGISDTPGSTVIYEVYTEPQYSAFHMLIPAGWNAQSQVQFPAGGLAVGFSAASPDQTAGIQFENPRAMRYSYPYDGQEGVVTFGGTHTQYYYRTADQYVSDILIPEYRQTLSADMQLTKQLIVVDQPGVSSGFFELLFSRGELDYTMQVYVATYGAIISGQIPEWSVNLSAVSSTTDQIHDFAEVGWNALGSKTANADFVLQYIGSAEPATDQSDAFFEALHSIQQSQSRLDAGFQGFSDATLGVRQVVDPLGNTYTVSESHTWWYRGVNSGLLYGSDSGQPSAREDLVPLQ